MQVTPLQIEERIIGALIYNGKSSVLEAVNIIDETDFSDPECSILFGACVSLVLKHKGVDEINIYAYLGENAQAFGTHFARLSGLYEAQKTVAMLAVRATELCIQYGKREYSFDLLAHCHALKDERIIRETKEALRTLNRNLDDCENVDEALSLATKTLIALSVKAHNVKPYQSLDDAFDEAIKETKDEIAGNIVRLPTGFPDLDKIIFGLEKGRLYCIAAEEKVGKSLFSYQVALHNAKLKKPVGIVSLEMRSPEIAKRFAGINSGQAAEKRLEKLLKRKFALEQVPLYIRDGSLNEKTLFTVIHKLFSEKQIDLLVVDYLQLVQMQDRDRVNEINNVVIRLKGLAMELNIPIVLVAAVLNKQINGRTDRKPKPSDIRDTGRLANDADCTMFLWKPDEHDNDYLELFVACSRYSPLGKIGLQLDRTEVRLGETLVREVVNNSKKTFNDN